MDNFYTKMNMELSGIHPEFGIPTSIFPRFPPGISPPSLGMVDQKRLKEKFFSDNASINSKLQDFNQMYQKFASGLFELAYPALPPSHPLYSRLESTISLQNENEKLKKENLELKKQIPTNKKIS
ncbi:MAG: hypothetical protein ACE5RN_00990 [Nitrosopumilaceae archaeon]